MVSLGEVLGVSTNASMISSGKASMVHVAAGQTSAAHAAPLRLKLKGKEKGEKLWKFLVWRQRMNESDPPTSRVWSEPIFPSMWVVWETCIQRQLFAVRRPRFILRHVYDCVNGTPGRRAQFGAALLSAVCFSFPAQSGNFEK